MKSQIFVKTSDSPDKVVSIDLLSTGNNLINVLKEELQEDITKYNVKFGTKKVGRKSTICIFEMWQNDVVKFYLKILIFEISMEIGWNIDHVFTWKPRLLHHTV